MNVKYNKAQCFILQVYMYVCLVELIGKQTAFNVQKNLFKCNVNEVQ